MSVTVEGLLDEYERSATMRGVKATTMNALIPIRRALGMLEPGDLTPSRIRAYTNERQMGCWSKAHAQRGAQSGTIRRELGALTAALNWCVSRRLIERASLPFIDLPAPSPPREVFMPLAEADAFWDFAAGMIPVPASPVALFACLALDTWARAASIETLTWDKVDLDLGRIDYRDLTSPQTAKRRVAVPISPRLLPVLKTWRELHNNDNVVCGPVTHYQWRAFVNLSPARKDLCRHDLRRTGISLAIGRGVDPMKVAQMAGDDYETIMKHYARFAPDYLAGVWSPGSDPTARPACASVWTSADQSATVAGSLPN
jgi:integrase